MSDDGVHPPDAPTGFAKVTDQGESSPSWLPWAGLGVLLGVFILFGLHALVTPLVDEVDAAQEGSASTLGNDTGGGNSAADNNAADNNAAEAD